MSKGADHPLVSVLGPLRITKRAVEHPVTDKAMRAVLSLLVAEGDRGVSADALVEAAWQGTPARDLPFSPLDSLETRITRLRTLLAPDADITWTARGCVLHVEGDQVDAVWFERMIEAARWCSPQEAISTLTRALALWRGEALPDLRLPGREHPQALRLRQLRSAAVENLAARELAAGHVEDAAGRLLALLSAEPLRERACEHAMRALHRLGMTADAATCYAQLAERLSDELGETPSIELRETYRAVTGREPPSPPSVFPARLPRPRTSFTGRGHELARLSTMLDRDRLVTVIGQAGSGKTRLTLEALSITDLPATFVRLSTTDAGDVVDTVATALGLHPWGGDDAGEPAGRGQRSDLTPVLAEYLCGRRHILVLDGCEQLLTPVRALVRKLAARCRDVTIVTTSRVRLGLAGERVLPLGPLARDGVRDPLLSRAGRLFLDRARQVRPGFPAGDDDTESARAVLRRVDCLPLTVELLAARVASEGCATPSHWPADLVEWSYDALSGAQRDLLASLTVFGGDVDVASARNVVETDGDVECRLAELARTGLLTATTSGSAAEPRAADNRATAQDVGADIRYQLPDLVRRLAIRHLSGTESEHKIRQRHALRCVDMITEAVRQCDHGDDVGAFLRLCRAEDDVAVALRWALTEEPALAAELTGLVGLITAYRPRPRLLLWQLRVARDAQPLLSRHCLAAASGADAAVRCGLPEEGLRLAARAAELATTVDRRSTAVRALTRAYYDLADNDRTAAGCYELLGLSDVGDAAKADAHAFLALVAARTGHREDGLREAGAAARFARAAGSRCRIALAAYAEGVLRGLADPADGVPVLVRARSEAKAAQASWITASAGSALADALVTLGRIPEAGKILQLTLDDWHRMRAPRTLRTCTDIALRCLASAGDRAGAEALIRGRSGFGHTVPEQLATTARGVATALAGVFGTAHP